MKYVKKREFLHCWRHKLVQSLWKIIWGFLNKLIIDLLYDSATLLLVIYLKERKSTSQNHHLCTLMFITVLLTIVKVWKEVFVDDWMDKENVVHLST